MMRRAVAVGANRYGIFNGVGTTLSERLDVVDFEVSLASHAYEGRWVSTEFALSLRVLEHPLRDLNGPTKRRSRAAYTSGRDHPGRLGDRHVLVRKTRLELKLETLLFRCGARSEPLQNPS